MLNLLADIVIIRLQRVNHHTILQGAGITGMLHTSQKFKISNTNILVGVIIKRQTTVLCLGSRR